MDSPLDDRFDGTWRFANENDEEGWNYLHFSKGNRIVQFYNINAGKFEKGQCLVGKINDDFAGAGAQVAVAGELAQVPSQVAVQRC